MIDYETLKTFKLIAELGNFSSTANILGVTQPAVTARIKNLETFLGVPLFIRKEREVILSNYGVILYKEINPIMDKLERLKSTLIRLSKESRDKLRFATSTTIGDWFIPRIIQKFVREQNITLEIFIGNTREVVEGITSRYFSFGIVEGNVKNNSLNIMPIADDELVPIKSIKSQIPDELSIKEIVKYPLILREKGSGTRAKIENVLSNSNCCYQSNIIAEIGDNISIINFISNNPDIVAFVPKTSIRDNCHIKTIKLKDAQISRKFSLLIHKQACLSVISKKFIAYLMNNSSDEN